MRVVADSHALVWYGQASPRLSNRARASMNEAEATDGIVVSTATLIDLWYVTQTTKAISTQQLNELRELVDRSSGIEWRNIDTDVASAYSTIDRGLMRDPWDRLIVSTAMTMAVPLVTKDSLIAESHLTETIW